MKLYNMRLGWTDGLGALIFHGQQANVADLTNLTSIFQVAAIYEGTRFAEAKLVIGYMIGTFRGLLTGYSEGHYVLTPKGGRRQLVELRARGLKPEEVWILDPR